MAKSNNNIVTHGLSGKVGDILVFSQRNGKTVVSMAPKASTKELTPGQKQHRQKFQKAIIYAKGVSNNPDLKSAYESKAGDGISAFNIAVADMLSAPEIESIDLSGYHGHIGDKIIIHAADDFKVKEVTVSISNDDTSLVEEGNAVLDTFGLDWIYTAIALNTNLNGDKIVITASDLPGNISLKDEVLA